MIGIIIPLALVLGLILTANRVAISESSQAHKQFTLLLIFINIGLAIFSLLFFFLPEENVSLLLDTGAGAANVQTMAFILLATSLWGIIVCWLPFRNFLARFMALDVRSPVHLTALVLAGYLVGNTALALSQEFLQQVNPNDLAVSILDVIIQQAGFALLALTGAGLFVRSDLEEVYLRLGLVKPSVGELVIGMGVIVLLILIQGSVGAIWALLDPEQAAQLGSLNEALLAGFDSVGEWLVLAVASGIGEEVLFRGALQPVFGLPLTSLLFAVVHIQYGLTPITFVVFFLGLILGLVRRYSSTTVAIFVHFGYNFALGLLSMLAMYLEQFVTP